ncbi:MAG: hypothetical protein WCQ16_06260 [Verrucomicrobiae bacterium]
MKTTTKPNTDGFHITDEELSKTETDRIFSKAFREMAELTDEELDRITEQGGITVQNARTTSGKIMITQRRGDRVHAILTTKAGALRLADSLRNQVNFLPDLLSGKLTE